MKVELVPERIGKDLKWIPGGAYKAKITNVYEKLFSTPIWELVLESIRGRHRGQQVRTKIDLSNAKGRTKLTKLLHATGIDYWDEFDTEKLFGCKLWIRIRKGHYGHRPALIGFEQTDSQESFTEVRAKK